MKYPNNSVRKIKTSGRSRVFFERLRKARMVAVVTILVMAAQLIYPVAALAVTGGPSSPEFSSFEPVATTNMVNEFSGQFTYNLPVLEIPGAAGGGYALSLAYHSGDGPESEASWVGHGWTLNPGSIIRNKRGLPDDYNGQTVKYYNSMPTNWTVAATVDASAQAFSSMLGGSLSATVRYNNYKGYSMAAGIGLTGLKGLLSLNYMNSDGTGTFSAAVNPASILSFINTEQKQDLAKAYWQANNEFFKKAVSGVGQAAMRFTDLGSTSSAGISSYAHYLLTSTTSPYNLTPFNGRSFEGYVQITGDPFPVPIGASAGLNISYVSQKNVAERTVPVYGYMYSGNGLANHHNDTSFGEAMFDYTVENQSTFNQRDLYLPIPSSTPDAYMVSGEGLSGAFRMYNDQIGIFSPNFVESSTTTHHFGLDVHLGADVGLGGDFTVDGWHTMHVKSSWPDGNGNTDTMGFVPYNFRDTTHQRSENMFFRFNNDLGGKVLYDDGDAPITPVISGGQPTLPASLRIKKDGPVIGANRRGGRASYIGYHTNKEIATFSGDKRPLAYEPRYDVSVLAGRSDTFSNRNIDDEVGELSIVNEGGNRYTYGLPVYTGGEKSMRQSVSGIGGKYIRYATLGDNKVGEEYAAPYASQYLLTTITTPDYLDVNGNGPDAADFGGYTRFSYRRVYGGTDKSNYSGWYKWRSPYNGVMFAPNRLSDNTDDMGSYQYGYKEVYYLDTVQTKTHYAIFITDDRQDGLDASVNEISAASTNSAQGSNHVQRLKRIELYAKATHPGDPDKLIKTVNFEYDYSIWPGNPNSLTGQGKLTLKKVWFEYNGVTSARISPYLFDYRYPSTVSYPAQYQYIQDEMTASGTRLEAPPYNPYIDCWGNYQDDGQNRRDLYKTWRSQNPSTTFDPAAYQLKRITLPSGGEIHVQYEENTYSYVQDKPACALVSLLDDDAAVASNSTYTINTDELGIYSDADKDALVDLIKRTYDHQKIFFKFFYTLKSLSTADMGSCNGDYVEGYVNFTDCFKVGSGSGSQIKVAVDGLPRKVCKDYVHYEIGGKLFDDNCNSSVLPGDIGTGTSDLSAALSSLASTFVNKVYTSIPGADICMRAKNNISYLRIPIPKKKGGGVRVKRLLMYNKGVDVNAPSLYGTEYVYDNESNGTSYGVATNEPFENKGENPLVNFMLKRGEQSDWDRLIAGRDREKFEGPISWNILPAPSIGYSRVIKKNIYQSQGTGTGYTVCDYYTVKDYPYDRFYPTLHTNGTQKSDVQQVKDWGIDFSCFYGMLDYDISTAIASAQGYSFIQNQMHGQIRQVSDYRGRYDPVRFYDVVTPVVPVSQKTYRYFEPGEQIPMYDFSNWNIYYDQPGKETDVTVERRCVEEKSQEVRMTGDITVGMLLFIPVPYIIGFPIKSESDIRMSSIVSNKVMHYPAIMKSMSVMKDGYCQTSDYVAFDPLTTKPVLTSTYDGFNGLNLPMDGVSFHNGKYTAYNVPASSNYSAMGQKAWNERYYYYDEGGISVTTSTAGNYKVANINNNGIFSIGDLVALHYKLPGSTYDGVEMANIVNFSGAHAIVAPTKKYNASLTVGSSCYKVEVISSGHTNQLGSTMDGLTEYGTSLNLEAFLAEINHVMDLERSGAVNNVTISMYKYGFKLKSDCYSPSSFNQVTVSLSGGNFNITLPGMSPIPSSVYIGAHHFGATTVLSLMNPDSTELYPTNVIVCPDKVMNIIKAQVTTYSDDWRYDQGAGIDTINLNHYESGMRGKWRPYETYVYRDSTVRGTNVLNGDRNYNMAGTTPFTLDTWSNIMNVRPGKWIRSNHIDAYTPNGHATQEFDAENVFSAAKYGYNGFLPYMVAQNAQRNSIHFESFENVYTSSSGSVLEDLMPVTFASITKDPHTGKFGYSRQPGESIKLPTTTDATGHGLNLRFWVKVNGAPTNYFKVSSSPASAGPLVAQYIARSGEWALYEAVWTRPTSVSLPAAVDVTITNISPIPIVFDDIRIQPTDAKATSYVYDIGTYKLSAVLDDQHFATFYQYNGEGKLVRTLVETIRGTKTVEESQYHVPTQPHP